MSAFIEKYFPKDDLDRLERAVTEAEHRTDGEIALVITRRSSGTWQDGWLIAAPIGLLTALVCLAVTYDSGWGATYDYGLALTAGVVGFVLALLLQRPWTRTAKSKRVWEKALKRFAGLRPTRAKTGVLLYISLEEHQVAVVADVAIAAKVPANYWDGPRDKMVAGFRLGRPTDAVIEAVQEIGSRLAEHFPRSADDTDELPNRPVID